MTENELNDAVDQKMEIYERLEKELENMIFTNNPRLASNARQDLLGMIPGLSKQAKDIEIDEREFDRLQAIIQSMTPEERAKPEIINGQRKKRIAAGCGQRVEDVNKLLAQFKQMQKMFKQMNSKQSRKALKRMSRNIDMNNLDNMDLSSLGIK